MTDAFVAQLNGLIPVGQTYHQSWQATRQILAVINLFNVPVLPEQLPREKADLIRILVDSTRFQSDLLDFLTAYNTACSAILPQLFHQVTSSIHPIIVQVSMEIRRVVVALAT
jgi:hypothetical protein